MTTSPRTRRLLVPALAAVLALVALSPSRASASHSESTLFDASQSFVYATPKDRAKTLNKLDSLGTDTIRIVIQWRAFTPNAGVGKKPAGFLPSDSRTYPNGIFSGLDAIVQGAQSRGMNVLLTPAAPIPDWASASGHSDVANPKPVEFRRFFAALGTRYSGDFHVDQGHSCPGASPYCEPVAPSPALPRISFWSVYNEPNVDLFLKPQFKNGRPYAPQLYRKLFLAAQAGLAATGHDKDRILIGETAPSGGLTSTDPLDFVRGVLCLNSSFHRKGNCAPIDASGWAHHPYNPGVAPFVNSNNPNLIGLSNIGRLTSALARAGASGATTRKLPVYVTEFGVQSFPDRAHGVSLAKQVAYLAIAEFISWNNASIHTYSQYLLHDDPSSYVFSFTTGLELHSGSGKPSLRSFPMTLLPKRLGRRQVRLWGHVRPGGGPFRVELRYRDNGGASKRLRIVRTNPLGYFSVVSPYRDGRTWEANTRIPGGRKLAGPYIRAYSF